jgi:tripartite-type tricarboxylate transporter receptor subunit TctC
LLSKALGQTVIVDNVTGASGSIAAGKMFAAPSDGNVLMMVSPTETIMPPIMMSSVKYKAEDFRLLVNGPAVALALIMRPGLNFKNVDELIVHARNPANKPLTYGSLGIGSIPHLAGEHFEELTSTKLTHVPYRGGAPLITDLVGNQVDISFFPLAGATMQMIDTGKLKAVGVTLAQKLPQYSKFDLLTAHPLLKSFVHTAWQSVAIPKSVPLETAERLHRELNGIFQSEEIRLFATKNGTFIPEALGLRQIETEFNSEIARTRSLAKSIKMDAQ